MEPTTQQPTLVLGGTGKTGRRVVQRLQARGRPVRVGTPSGTPPFDWTEATWPAALDGVESVYVTYYPD
ncbi:MAG TPA: NmrA family transcriptional regulator, partial [Propionibacteriaceae bacterium]|nr:NmrA family transcriptional regulator [Propionibacteriaceae bacterium]